MKLRDIFEEFGAKLPSYWIGRHGEVLNINRDTHIYYVLRNPEIFGLRPNEMKMSTHDIMDILFNVGWVRISGGSGGNIGIQANRFNPAAFALKQYLDIVGDVDRIELDIGEDWYNLPIRYVNAFIRNPRALPTLSKHKA